MADKPQVIQITNFDITKLTRQYRLNVKGKANVREAPSTTAKILKVVTGYPGPIAVNKDGFAITSGDWIKLRYIKSETKNKAGGTDITYGDGWMNKGVTQYKNAPSKPTDGGGTKGSGGSGTDPTKTEGEEYTGTKSPFAGDGKGGLIPGPFGGYDWPGLDFLKWPLIAIAAILILKR